MLNRLCNLPKSHSFFLFGPRQTGKTTLINQFIADKRSWGINLLDREVYLRYISNPSLLYLEGKKRIEEEKLEYIFIDEIQKVPALLDEVQRLIQETDTKLILTGSSARKLKRSSANLLGGRALERNIFPLTAKELANHFSLDEVLQFGSLPSIYNEKDETTKIDLLSSYISTYLVEEIQQESIVRNLPGFATFLEVVAQQSGQILNYASVGRDADLHGRTVQSYYQILVDTLIAVELKAYTRSVKKRLRKTPKFYLFDIGVLNALERQLRSNPDVIRLGKLFEHFIILETHRLTKYLSPDGRIFYWRTKDDQEVDLLIENKGQLIAAIEIKSSKKITKEYLGSLKAFADEYPSVPRYVVSNVPENYDLDGITVLNWKSYLIKLEKWLSC
jgi:predicted AAA+ superfamily ATPase